MLGCQAVALPCTEQIVRCNVTFSSCDASGIVYGAIEFHRSR